MVRIWSGGRQRPWDSRTLDAEWSMLAFSEAVVSAYVRGRLKNAALEVALRRWVRAARTGKRRSRCGSTFFAECVVLAACGCSDTIAIGLESVSELVWEQPLWSGAVGNDTRIGQETPAVFVRRSVLVWGGWKRRQNWSRKRLQFWSAIGLGAAIFGSPEFASHPQALGSPWEGLERPHGFTLLFVGDGGMCAYAW